MLQRAKGQTSSGNNRELKDERLDRWRTQPNQVYSSTMATASNIPENPYLSNYYAYSCLNQGLGDGTWNSSSGDTIAYLGQIGREPTHYLDGLVNPTNYNNYPGFAYFSTGSDYSAWGNSLNPRKPNAQGENREDYYFRDMYNPAPYPTIKPLEHRMEGLSLQTPQNNFQFFKDTYGKSDAMTIPENHANDHFGKKAIFPITSPGITLNEQTIIPKNMSWASVASKPIKLQTKSKSKSVTQTPILANKHNSTSMDIGTWENKNGNNEGNKSSGDKTESSTAKVHSSPWNSPRGNRHQHYEISQSSENNGLSRPVLDKLCTENNYNPKEFDLNPKNARFFIIKSYSEDDVHRSIKYSIWCSTEHGNKRLDAAFRENSGKGPIYLFYSVNGSGHFCGMAEMISHVDYNSNSNIWAQDKWKGQFQVKWIYVKDVPNSHLRHIRLENNDNKPVTNSRDTQEVPLEKGKQVLKLIHSYNSMTSIFDDFNHYEKRQQEEEKRKKNQNKLSKSKIEDMDKPGKEVDQHIDERYKNFQRQEAEILQEL